MFILSLTEAQNFAGYMWKCRNFRVQFGDIEQVGHVRFVRPLLKALSHYMEVFLIFRLDVKEIPETSDSESCVAMKSFESRRKEFQ